MIDKLNTLTEYLKTNTLPDWVITGRFDASHIVTNLRDMVDCGYYTELNDLLIKLPVSLLPVNCLVAFLVITAMRAPTDKELPYAHKPYVMNYLPYRERFFHSCWEEIEYRGQNPDYYIGALRKPSYLINNIKIFNK